MPRRLFPPLMLLLASCTTSEEPTEEWTNEPTVATALADTSVFLVFGHEVRDYAVWKQVHTDLDVVRQDWGITDAYLMQGADEDSVAGLCSGDSLAGIVTDQKRHGRLDAGAVELTAAGQSWGDQLDLNSKEQVVSVVALKTS